MMAGKRLGMMGVAVAVWATGASAWSAEGGGPELSRIRAALAGLTYRPSDTSVVFGGVSQTRWRPAAVPAQVRQRLGQISLAMVHDGGYEVAMAEKIFLDGDPARHRNQRPLRQLDQLRRQEQAPRAPAGPAWPATGRYGDLDPDIAAMKPAQPPAPSVAAPTAETPGTLIYLVPLAAAYAAFADDGLVAATHLAEWVDNDYRAAACARVAFALLAELLAGPVEDRDGLLRRAASASGDAEVSQTVLAARVKDWKQLRNEDTSLGRLERCVYLWYHARESREMLVDAGQKLTGWEARGYTAALAGATFGTEGFPPEAITALLQNRPLDDLAFQLCELGEGGAVLAVTLPSRAITAYNGN